MTRTMFKLTNVVRGGLVLVGCTGAVYSGMYVYKHVLCPAEPKNEALIQLAALTLSSQVVDSTLHSDEFLKGITDFGLKVLTDRRTVEELKTFFRDELTEDTLTRRALKDFFVEDVLKDSWVKEELIGIVGEVTDDVKSDDALFTDLLLKTWLLGAVKDSATTPELKSSAYRFLYATLWYVFIGPPDKAIRFDNPFA
ncbi:hypothetical protein AGDE_05039 [Angomonas deanei]|uniref:Uncharacterized protein n=1 Tax=Angomonas deanei TaxID=59799 RepID=A0A7G2CIB0_9TRYP|nr:hypothetical protein AGDE_05039 [Angomonas deanei]CAD2217972.1 hypothetical protein, conserved [Angomonas deanei]|eukprot:EPY38890.1 hypothetical protein AGDE_05039 [Angomonas deanei]